MPFFTTALNFSLKCEHFYIKICSTQAVFVVTYETSKKKNNILNPIHPVVSFRWAVLVINGHGFDVSTGADLPSVGPLCIYSRESR